MAGSLRVYLDEDVSVLLCRLLAARGIDCQTCRDASRLGRDDESQLRFSTGERRILVTHNRLDFERLAVAWWTRGEAHGGIVLAIRRNDPYDLARHVLPVLYRFEPAGWENVVAYA